MESDELYIEHKPLVLEPDELPPTEPFSPNPSPTEWLEIDVPVDDDDCGEPPTTYIDNQPEEAPKPTSLVARFDLDDPECTMLTVAELPASARTPVAPTLLTDFVHKCHYCVSRFAAMDGQLRGHVARHARFECGTCEERFHVESERDWHRHFVHGMEIAWEEVELGMLYICKCCHLRFGIEDELLRHFDACHRGYIEAEFPERLEALDVLMGRKRTEEKCTKPSTNYFCKSCALLFLGTSNIEAHLQLHKEREITKPSQQLRDYRCLECSDEFFSKFYLINHLNEHARNHNLKSPATVLCCCFCGQQFRTPENLKLHIRLSHAVANPIRCSFCEEMLKRAELYWSHCRTEHGAVVGFPCGKCDQVFRSALECREHDEESHLQEVVRKVVWKRKLQPQKSRDKQVGAPGTLGANGKNKAIFIRKV